MREAQQKGDEQANEGGKEQVSGSGQPWPKPSSQAQSCPQRLQRKRKATERGPDFHARPLPPSLPSEPADIPFLVAALPRSSASPERHGVCAAGCDLLLSPVSAAGLCTFLGNESDPPRQCLIRA